MNDDMIKAFQVVEKAAEEADLDAAVRHVQDFVGQEDGGLAGMIFGDEEMAEWGDMSISTRYRHMGKYMLAELLAKKLYAEL